jgi:DNA-binding NarL/FixJ family response regulator
MKTRIGVLVVDDSPKIREALTGMLRSYPEMHLLGTAADGDEGIEQARTLKPDVVLMDIRMPRRSGLDATRVVKALPHPPKVIVVTADDSEAHRKAAAAAGADAFCSKLRLAAELHPTILALFPDAGAAPRQA